MISARGGATAESRHIVTAQVKLQDKGVQFAPVELTLHARQPSTPQV